jgi:hypothetical protein
MKIINENGDPDFEFTSALMKLLGIEEDEVAEVIENLEVDDLTDLIDACVRGDVAEAKRIIGSETEESEPDGEDLETSHEKMASQLFSPKDKTSNQDKKYRPKKLETVEEDSEVSFGIGDEVSVNGHNATIKIPSAAGRTVGVMINGELKMINKKNVHPPIKEGVLGMTGLPGLKPNSDLQRIRELAGLRDEDNSFDVHDEADFPGQPPMTPPLETSEPVDMNGSEDLSMSEPESEMDSPEMSDMGSKMEPDTAPALALPAPANMSSSMPSPGSALEDAAALDQAISEIENLIPNVKISEYKTLVARLKALVSMAESAGKAALTEGRSIAQRQGLARGAEMDEGSLPFSMSPQYKSNNKPKHFDGEKAKVLKPDALKQRIGAFVTGRRHDGKVEEEFEVPEKVQWVKAHRTKFNSDFHTAKKAVEDGWRPENKSSDQPNKEEITELSKDTLGSYVKKAANNRGEIGYENGRIDHQATGTKFHRPSVQDRLKSVYKKDAKREKGIERATDRLTREDRMLSKSQGGEFSDDDLNDHLADKEAESDRKFAAKYPKPENKEGSRKTLMDYVREAEDDMQTIGMDRNTALKAFQARMGPAASPQQANQAFDAMFAAGKVKQQNGHFMMPAMSDEDFHTAMSQTTPTTATGGMSNATATPSTTSNQGQNSGQNTTNPGANTQGSSNSAYQGR